MSLHSSDEHFVHTKQKCISFGLIVQTACDVNLFNMFHAHIIFYYTLICVLTCIYTVLVNYQVDCSDIYSNEYIVYVLSSRFLTG